MTDTTISDSAHVMAEAARRDPRITIKDIVDQMQAEVALENFAEGMAFDRDKARDALLTQHPHLQSRYP
jgi:hypothetical protein